MRSIFALRHLVLVIVGVGGLSRLSATAQASILGDMGVTVGNNNTSVYAMAPRTAAWAMGQGVTITGQTNVGSGHLYYNIEDQDDKATTSGFVGPRYGGQDYDAEFLGVLFSGSKISIGILTGQRFDNELHGGLHNFSPGDIRIRTTVGEFWIEVGGSGNGSDGVALGENGSTYILNSSGYTINSSTSNSTVITAGMIIKNPGVKNAVPSFSPLSEVPVQIDPLTTVLSPSNTFIAESYAYTYYSGSQHAGIEVSFDAGSVFGIGTTIQSVEWRPSCGNDEVLYLGMNRTVNPEPASVLIWGGLGLGTALIAWRKRKGMTTPRDH